MNEISFDINAIVSISLYKERESFYYRWQEEKPIRHWFFNYKTGKISPAGWINHIDIFSDFIFSESELKNKGLRIASDKKVYDAPYIIIKLINGDSVQKTFNTDLEATNWITALKLKSGKIFETIVYS